MLNPLICPDLGCSFPERARCDVKKKKTIGKNNEILFTDISLVLKLHRVFERQHLNY